MAERTPEEKAKLEKFNKELESNISRWVTGLVVPLLLPASTIISFYVQKWLGFKLSAGSLAGFLGTIVAGVGVTAYKFIDHLGSYQEAVLDIVKLHELGDTKKGP